MKRSVSLSRWLAIPTVFFVMVLGGLSMSPAGAAPGNGGGHAHQAAKAHAAGKKDAKGSSSKAEGGNGGGTTTVKHTRPNSYQAQADPDGLDNGGVDQPGGQGGTVGSQDGNNGSGNDTDCEDDNRGKGVPGHCKQRDDTSAPAKTGPAADTKESESDEDSAPTTPSDAIGTAPVEQALTPGIDLTAPVVNEVAGVSAEVDASGTPAEVAAVSAERSGVVNRPATGLLAQAGILPQTGLARDLTLVGLAGLALALAGGAVLALQRKAVSRT